MIKYSILICTVGTPQLTEVATRFLSDAANDFELLVIVDNPKFDVQSALGHLLYDARLRILNNSTNIGLTKSLIRGVEASLGNIIVRNDDDDFPETRRLAEIRKYFQEHPETDFLFSFAVGVDETGKRWKISAPRDPSEIKAALARRNFIVASSVAYKKDSVLAVGNYNPLFRYAQDYELYLRLSRAGARFACLSDVLVERFYSPNSITVQKRKTQMLYSFAARLIHAAELKDQKYAALTIGQYAILYITPQWLRKLRRRLGLGR